MASLRRTLLIAPCGMNCGICMAFLRDKNPCPGCRGSNKQKPITRTRCAIKTCGVFTNAKAKYCFHCKEFPCKNLLHMDKRYRIRYHMSMIDNLLNIRNMGIRRFLQNEKTKWACSNCGGTICVHSGSCSECNTLLEEKPKKYCHT
jgi:hypothetical protein